MLKVYDTDTGGLLWQAQLSPATDTVDEGASATVAGSIVFVGTAGGELQAYDVAGHTRVHDRDRAHHVHAGLVGDLVGCGDVEQASGGRRRGVHRFWQRRRQRSVRPGR